MSPDGDGRLLLIRHTESAWNSLDVFTGWVDVPLSEAGRQHALEVGRSLKGRYRIDHAFCSGLTRAQETLEMVLEGAPHVPDIPISRDWHLNERYYGTWQGRCEASVAARYGEEAIKAVRKDFHARPPGGESLADIAERVLPYFEEHVAPEVARGQVVLVAAHISPLRIIARHLMGLSDSDTMRFSVANGAVLCFRREPDGAYLRED